MSPCHIKFLHAFKSPTVGKLGSIQQALHNWQDLLCSSASNVNVIFSTFVPLCKNLDGIKVGQVPIHVTSVGSVVYIMLKTRKGLDGLGGQKLENNTRHKYLWLKMGRIAFLSQKITPILIGSPILWYFLIHYLVDSVWLCLPVLIQRVNHFHSMKCKRNNTFLV